jgi:hypothetical protein
MPLIIESLLTTADAEGGVNVAPMGVEWGETEIVIKPFVDTTTFRNLSSTGAAVVNLTDDVLLFAQAVTGDPAVLNARTAPAAKIRGVILDAALAWREVEVVSIDATPPRSRIVTRVVHRGQRGEFPGINRARHAVLEAAILATRTHLIPPAELAADLARLQLIVDKTAGPREVAAMAQVRDFIAARLQGNPAR